MNIYSPAGAVTNIYSPAGTVTNIPSPAGTVTNMHSRPLRMFVGHPWPPRAPKEICLGSKLIAQGDQKELPKSTSK